MKTVLRFFLAACLLVVLSSGVLAVPGPMFFFGDFASFGEGSFFEMEMSILAPGERLFSTDERDSQLKLQGFFGVDGPDMTLVDAEYYLNEIGRAHV